MTEFQKKLTTIANQWVNCDFLKKFESLGKYYEHEIEKEKKLCVSQNQSKTW